MGFQERLSIAWQRAIRWEFWPAWLFYIPIIAWIVCLGLRHRMPTAFTAANTALDNGGVVGERKHQALQPLQDNAADLVARFSLIEDGTEEQRWRELHQFMQFHNLKFPIVLKPDVGQRGRGVFVADDETSARDYLGRFHGLVIAQEFIDGEEFGVFISREPGTGKLQILSIVHKVFPSIVGDGNSTLRHLILQDPRARLIAGTLFQAWREQLKQVPAAGQKVALVQIGSHCRGSVFLDACYLQSQDLEKTLERLSDAVPGYRFGRIDLRAPSQRDLQQGQGLKVLELNGVTSESAHIYHPGSSLLNAYKAMFRQWSIAFRLGRAHVQDGARLTSAFQLLSLFREDLKRSEEWF